MYFSDGDIDDNTCIKDLHECISSNDEVKDNDNDNANDNNNYNNNNDDKGKSSSYIIGIYALKYSQIYI